MGYIAALLIGLSLGLIGGGGSILTVPILVYLFDVPPILATSYSLFIVGVTSLVGSIKHFVNKKMDFRTILSFGTASVITVFCMRHYVIPHLPETLHIANYLIPLSFVTMMFFASLMIVSSFSMIKGMDYSQTFTSPKISIGKTLVYGCGVGLVTGLLGAGGGFLLMPFLIILLRLPVKTAIGISLVIITINSLIGFADDVTHHQINWHLLLKITGMSIAGVVIGMAIGKKIEGGILKKGFGWFVLAMGIYIIIHECILLKNKM